MTTLADLRTRAADLGARIDEDHVETDGVELPGYWLLDAETGDGVWDDENFASSLEELDGMLDTLAAERRTA